MLFDVFVSVMAIIFGKRGAVRHALRSVLGRRFSSCRCVVRSNYSDSGAMNVTGSCRGGFGKELHVCSRGSGKVCSTVGQKVRGTGNSCI